MQQPNFYEQTASEEMTAILKSQARLESEIEALEMEWLELEEEIEAVEAEIYRQNA